MTHIDNIDSKITKGKNHHGVIHQTIMIMMIAQTIIPSIGV